MTIRLPNGIADEDGTVVASHDNVAIANIRNGNGIWTAWFGRARKSDRSVRWKAMANGTEFEISETEVYLVSGNMWTRVVSVHEDN